MAANLFYSEKLDRHAFFTVREKAWHNLGVILSDYPSKDEAILAAGLDFEVAKAPVLFDNGSKINTLSRKFTTYRTDTGVGLGVVGEFYTPIQNKDAFKFFDIVVGEGEALYETAGQLGNGETVFITAKLPGHMIIRGKDVVDQYLFLANYHDGIGGSLVAALTPIRVVCNNTLTAALKNNSMKIKIHHRANFEQAMVEARKVITVVNSLAEELNDVYNLMARKTIVDSELRQMVLKSIASPGELNRMVKDEELAKTITADVDKIMEYNFTSPDQQLDTTRGTAWGAYNAITGYYQNVKKWRSHKSQFVSTMQGETARNAQKMFMQCLEKIK